MTSALLHLGDCLDIMREMPDNSVDLVFCSPPYEAARTYGIDFKLKGEEYVEWCLPRYLECLRICNGLVAWVIEGQTRQFRYSAVPLLLMADLHRQGVHLRKPPIYRRDGIPGSGGPDWLANKYEFIVCATSGGKLPWSDNTACGHPPKYGPGGSPSHRKVDGDRAGGHSYVPPKKANPGNIFDCGAAGGGNIGSKIAHENEAPFPEKLAEFFVKSFCKPEGIVFDPFCGSGTTLKVAINNGRQAIGGDIRESQLDLTRRRLEECHTLLENT